MSKFSVRDFMHSIALFAIVLLGVAWSARADENARYVDHNFGFSFSKPRFVPSDERGVTTVVVTLAGSRVNSFAPSVNVVVQNIETSLVDYKQQQARDLEGIGWEVVEQSIGAIGGTPALRTRARGSLQGLKVEFLAVAIIGDEGKAYVLTCTSSTRQFPFYQAEFDRIVSSFAIQD